MDNKFITEEVAEWQHELADLARDIFKEDGIEGLI